MAAQAWFSRGDVDDAPGTVAVLQLTVVNLGDTTDTFVLTPSGMAAAWTTINPATLTLFGGTQQVVDLEVFPPLLPSTTAGPTSLSVRIVPQSDPDEVRTAPASLLAFGSWLSGDGAMAWCALDHVPQGKPYALGNLVATAIERGLHPREWEAAKSMPEHDVNLAAAPTRTPGTQLGHVRPAHEL